MVEPAPEELDGDDVAGEELVGGADDGGDEALFVDGTRRLPVEEVEVADGEGLDDVDLEVDVQEEADAVVEDAPEATGRETLETCMNRGISKKITS